MGRMAKAVNLCPGQLRWFACVLGAAAQRPWFGMKLGRTWFCIQLGTGITMHYPRSSPTRKVCGSSCGNSTPPSRRSALNAKNGAIRQRALGW
jgi:hypothetical protein